MAVLNNGVYALRLVPGLAGATVTEHVCNCEREAEGVDLTLLDSVLKQYAGETGALIPVLQHAQEVYGYLPEPVLAAIAQARRVPFSEVYGVATFYSQFHLEPRGRTVVRICHGTACHVAGAPEVTRAVTDELLTKVGETSEDLRFTVEAVACVGCCGLAPVVVVGEETHGQLDPTSARKLGKRIYRGAPK